MKILGIIPSRYASTRFPGKPLAVIDGKTMIRRVYEQAVRCRDLARVIVATDHDTIFKHVAGFGGNVMMTGSGHRSGTERCAEVLEKLQRQGESYDAVINIQGDEPFIDPAQISEVAALLALTQTPLATLVRKISAPEELSNPDVVKVVTDHEGFALLFSRAAIPYVRGKDQAEWIGGATFYRHVGIYGYSSTALAEIVGLPAAEIEQAESLEQLRWLYHGYRIRTRVTEYDSMAVDSPADLLKFTNTGDRHQQ